MVNSIYIKDEKNHITKTLTLPANKTLYRGGLMSWTGSGQLCVACEANDGTKDVWFVLYDVNTDKIRSLFAWKAEEVTSFVIGPRMRWDRHNSSEYRSIY